MSGSLNNHLLRRWLFNFYQSVLGSEYSFLGRYKDMPAKDDPNKELFG